MNSMSKRPLNSYGIELILDLKDCNPEKFNRKSFNIFYDELCELLGVEKGTRHFWDYEDWWRNVWYWLFNRKELKRNAPPHLKGTSAVQFIMTSSLVIHALDDLGTLYINVFSCDNFNASKAQAYIEEYFEGTTVGKKFITRGAY